MNVQVGWLKGTRPLEDLAAKWELLGQFGVILVRMAIETKLTNLARDTVEAIYLRDNRLFFMLIVQTAVVSFAPPVAPGLCSPPHRVLSPKVWDTCRNISETAQ